MPQIMSPGKKRANLRAKAHIFLGLHGTAEAVHLPNQFLL